MSTEELIETAEQSLNSLQNESWFADNRQATNIIASFMDVQARALLAIARQLKVHNEREFYKEVNG